MILFPKEAALKKARSLCAKQERCRWEVLLKLRSWGLEEDEVESVMVQLVKDDYLNEPRFAEHYAVSKFRQKGWGRVKIGHALRRMQLAESDIARGLAAIQRPEYLASILTLVKKVRAKESGRDRDAVDLRVKRYLLSRGFEADAIDQALCG